MTGEVRVIPLEGIPEIEEGDDLARLVLDAADRVGGLAEADVLVVAQKAVSKSEGRVVRLDESSRPRGRSSSPTSATRATWSGSCGRAPRSSASARR